MNPVSAQSFMGSGTLTAVPSAPQPSSTSVSADSFMGGKPLTPVASSSPKQPVQTNESYSSAPGTGSSAPGAGSLGKALISSETGLGNDVAAGLSSILPKSVTGIGDIEKSTTDMANDTTNLAHLIKVRELSGQDTTSLKAALKSNIDTLKNMPGAAELYPALAKTNLQVVGDLAGTTLDILSAGTYGVAARGAETGVLLTKEAAKTAAEQAIKTGTEQAVKPTLTGTLKNIAKSTVVHSGIGGTAGYISDVSQNLQSGKTGAEAFTPGIGTAAGVALPLAIGGVRAGVAIGREEAPRVINSLIKPKAANFSYGKNPGRTVSDLGITGNSLPDFERNISSAKTNIGQQIGAVYSNPANEKVTINATDDIAKIDSAINDAAKGGKNNQAIVSQLQNVKDALLYEHSVNADGDIVKTGTNPRDLTNLSPKEAQALIQDVSSHTKFTGNPSDDKIVNSTLKDIYGGIRDKINDAVSPNNPEIIKLNERYGDLISAELAVRNRGAIVQRSNMVGLTPTIVGTASTIASLMSGQGDLKSVLIGVGAAGLEKALASTAVKTRVASWLASQTPEIIRSVTSRNPQIIPILTKMIPNIAAKLK